MRVQRRGGRAKFDHGDQRSAPIGNVGRGDYRHGQRLLRQILAHGATLAMLPRRAIMKRTRRIVLARCRSVPLSAVMVCTVMMCTAIVSAGIVAIRICNDMRHGMTMLMQKPMAAADDNRHKQVACGENESQTSTKTGHDMYQRGVETIVANQDSRFHLVDV